MQFYEIKDTSPYSLKSLNDQLRTLFTHVYGELGSQDIKPNGVATINLQDGAIDSIKIGKAEIKTANIADASITTAKIGDAQITNAKISNLEADRIKSDKIDVNDLTANTAFISNLSSIYVTTNYLTANYITASSISSNYASINYLTANYLTANTITSNYVTTNYLTANYITASSISSTYAKISTLTSDYATITYLNAQIATVNQANIDAARIINLDAKYITGGMLDMYKVKVGAANGRMSIANNRIQIFDYPNGDTGKPLFERISLGNVNGDETLYGLRIRGKDGTTVLIDETGVKREGITDGSINNAKIGSDAKIDGAKLDISTVIDQINNDGTRTIKGNRVLLTNTSLDVAFNDIKYSKADNITKVRYIRDYSNGSSVNNGNYWVEIKAFSGTTNVAKGKTVTSNLTVSNIARVTDDDVNTANYAQGTAGQLQYVQIDLGSVVSNIDYLQVYRFNSDGRTFHNTKTQVSEDGVTWVTLFDSAVSGEYAEVAAGKRIDVNAGKIIYAHDAAISANANEITLKVAKDSIVSSINASPESITINSNRLNLSGLVTITNLKTPGSVVIDGGNITAGTLDASKVTVTNLVVGTNVSMGANATISWANVTSQPTIPKTAADVGADPAGTASNLTSSDNMTKLNGQELLSQAFKAGLNDGFYTNIDIPDIATYSRTSNGIQTQVMRASGHTWVASADFIPVNPNSKLYLSGDFYTTAASTIYIGIEHYDKNKVALAENAATTYISAGSVSTINTWIAYGGFDTLWKGCAFVKLRFLINWNNEAATVLIGNISLKQLGASALQTYTTHIDSNGIYTGTLTANQINAITGIKLGANATIDWTYVSKPSYTAADVGARPSTWVPAYTDITGTKPPSNADNTASVVGNKLTKIDAYGVYTGTVTADQINGGTITGVTIKSVNGNNRIEMGSTSLTAYYSSNKAIELSNYQVVLYDWKTANKISGYLSPMGNVSDSTISGVGLVTSDDFISFGRGSKDNSQLDHQAIYIDYSSDTSNPHIWVNGIFYSYKGYMAATTWTGSIENNTTVTINHNLGRYPIMTFGGTLGNVNLNYNCPNSNQVQVYNYNSGGNTWYGTIAFW